MSKAISPSVDRRPRRSERFTANPPTRLDNDTVTLAKKGPEDDQAPFEDRRWGGRTPQTAHEAPGIDIPTAKLALYPGFPISRPADEAVSDMVVATLDRFVHMTRNGQSRSTAAR